MFACPCTAAVRDSFYCDINMVFGQHVGSDLAKKDSTIFRDFVLGSKYIQNEDYNQLLLCKLSFRYVQDAFNVYNTFNSV